MRFKWLANDCDTWDAIIQALQHRIATMEDLKAQGAILIQNNDDYIFYEIPGEHAVYATLTSLTNTQCTFQLDDDTTLTTQRPDWTDFTPDHLHHRFVLLLTDTGNLNGVTIPHNFPSDSP